jgi:beta-lactam-binding protein with PASTA domain
MAKRLLAVLIFLACAGMVFWFALVHTVHQGTLAVPDLGEQSLEEARRRVDDLGLELEVDEPGVFSTVVNPGLIAHQEPPPGFHVKSGSSVTVRVSLGGKTIEVPDVRSSSLNAAQREVERAGLALGTRARVEEEGSADSVIATGPPVGQYVAPVTRVDLLVNTVPHRQLWVMPSLILQPLDQVERFCRLNRWRMGRAREVDYPGFEPGIVLRQHPPAGSPVEPSEIITVWVSK